MSSASHSTNLVSVGGELVEKFNGMETGAPRARETAHEHKRGQEKKSRANARTSVKREQDISPTAERLAKGDVKEASGYRAQGVIERMMERNQLAPADVRENFALFRAAEKLEKLFYDAGLSTGVAAQDLSKVVVHGGEHVGMALTERQAHHRQQFRQAVKLLGWHESNPERGAGRLTVDVVCFGTGVEEAARKLMAPTRTSNLVTIGMDRLREGLYALAVHWRMC